MICDYLTAHVCKCDGSHVLIEMHAHIWQNVMAGGGTKRVTHKAPPIFMLNAANMPLKGFVGLGRRDNGEHKKKTKKKQH